MQRRDEIATYEVVNFDIDFDSGAPTWRAEIHWTYGSMIGYCEYPPIDSGIICNYPDGVIDGAKNRARLEIARRLKSEVLVTFVSFDSPLVDRC